MHEADAAALVPAHVQHDAATLTGHHRHGGVQLRTAIAAPRAEHVTGQALRVHPHQDVAAVVLRAGDIAANQCDVLHLVIDAHVADGPKLAVAGGNSRLGDPFDVLLVLAPVLDQIGDGDQRQAVFVGEDPQLVGLGHGALVLLADDLADGPGRLQARHPGQIHGGFGVAGTAQHPAVLGAQRNHVPRLGEIVGHAGRIGQQPHGGGPVGCRNTGSHTDFGVDGDGVGGAVLVLVDGVHGQQPEPVADRAVQRDAEVAGGVAHHEGHQLRGGLLGGEDQVAFVLAILVIDDDDGLARRDVGDRPFDGVQSGHLASMDHRTRASSLRPGGSSSDNRSPHAESMGCVGGVSRRRGPPAAVPRTWR